MDNREVTTLGVQIWFPEEKKLLMLAQTLYPGEEWFGVTIPEPAKGNQIMKIYKLSH